MSVVRPFAPPLPDRSGLVDSREAARRSAALAEFRASIEPFARDALREQMRPTLIASLGANVDSLTSERDRVADGLDLLTTSELAALDEVPRLSLVASAGTPVEQSIPVAPPREWFADPRLRAVTPLTVDPSGRVFGHLASWRECHLESSALGDVCTTAPRSRTGYARFTLGSVLTAEGDTVATGPIVMGAPHADPAFGLQAALQHYGNSARAVADVRVGEDAHGIWIAGALRPTVTPAQVRELRGSPLSGDWRTFAGHLELVAALAVNTPGFAIERPTARALIASAGGVQSAQGIGLVPQDPSKAAPGLVQPWQGVLAPENVPTGDGRLIAGGALTHATLPMPLRYAPTDTGGHNGAVVVGRIDRIARGGDGLIRGAGVLDLGSDVGREAARLIGSGFLRGVSIDTDATESAQADLGGSVLAVMGSGRIRAATLVSIPAFDEAAIELVGDPIPDPGPPASAPADPAAGDDDLVPLDNLTPAAPAAGRSSK